MLYTKCKHKGGAKLGNIVLEKSSPIKYPMHSLYMSFINCGSHDQY